MHRNKPRDVTWTDFYKDVPDAWKRAMRELVEFIFEDAPQHYPELSRKQQMHHRSINTHLDELVELVTELTSRKWKYRTRFGDKKLPCSECTQNRYHKLTPQENLAALARVFGVGDKKGLFKKDELEVDDFSGFVYLPLHTYSVEGRTTEKHDLRAALKAYFTDVPSDSEVGGVSLRLYLGEHNFTGERTEEAERTVWRRMLRKIRKDIAAIEEDREKFKDKCKEYYPLFEELRKVFAMGANDDELVAAKRQRVDADASDDEEEEESDPDEGDEEDDENQFDLHHVHHEMDDDEHVQQIDNHFCEVRRAMGVHPPRLTSFRGDIVQHTPELFYTMCSPYCDMCDRIPYVKAPTFKIGADLKWLKQESESGYLCKFKKPKESPLQGEVIKAKLNSMPKKQSKPIIHAYLKLQTMARKLNIRTRDLFHTIGIDAFDLVICLELKGGDRNDTVLQYTPYDLNENIAQELCLFYVYMNAIYKIPEHNPDHALEEAAEAEEDRVALHDTDESEADPDSDFDPDEEESDEEEDDDDSDDSDASDDYSEDSSGGDDDE